MKGGAQSGMFRFVHRSSPSNVVIRRNGSTRFWRSCDAIIERGSARHWWDSRPYVNWIYQKGRNDASDEDDTKIFSGHHDIDQYTAFEIS